MELNIKAIEAEAKDIVALQHKLADDLNPQPEPPGREKPVADFNPQPDPPGRHAPTEEFNPQPDPPGKPKL